MKTVTVSDLRHDFPSIEGLLKTGETVRISKRGKVVARLVPVSDSESVPEEAPLPDNLARLKI